MRQSSSRSVGGVSLLRQRGAVINGVCQGVVDAAQLLASEGEIKKGAYAGVMMQVKADPALANLAGVLKVKAHAQLHESEGAREAADVAGNNAAHKVAGEAAARHEGAGPPKLKVVAKAAKRAKEALVLAARVLSAHDWPQEAFDKKVEAEHHEEEEEEEDRI